MTSESLAQSGQEISKQADSFAREHLEGFLKSPEGLTFTIRLKDGRKQFRQGEIIGVELEFAGRSSIPYIASTASYDRSGRLGIDISHIDPQDGVADPLHDYFHSAVSGFMGGGLSSIWRLAEKPFRITQELNEWWRFDKPGKYRLYVTSGRIARERTPGSNISRRGDPLIATSNIIEFEVIPAEPAWSERKLHEALQVINNGNDQPDNGEGSDARRAACRVLRFLGTEAAAKEMIRRFRGRDRQCDYEYNFGLIGSPRRLFVVKEMERQLASPEQPVSTGFFYTLSLLSLNQQRTLPPYPGEDSEKARLWEAQAQEQREAFDDVRMKYAGQLAATVLRKEGEARAISLNTLLEFFGSIPREKRTSASTGLQEKIVAALTPVFFDLPPDTQYTLLNFRWKFINSPAMLPIIRRIYESPPQTSWPIREVALQRLYELAPREGRRLILEEIHSPHPKVRINVLGLLPEKSLPELNDFLAGQLERSDSESEYEGLSVYSSLIARYATAEALPRIKAAYEKKIGHIACAIQTPLLAYFLRVDPKYGAEMVEKALSARKSTGCYQSELTGVAALYMCPELEEVAVNHLKDSEPIIVSQAVATLGQYGSASAEDALWNRLEQWHQTWAGRLDELDIEEGVDVFASEAHIEIELVRALGQARGWVLSAEKLKRLTELCITNMGRQQAENLFGQANPEQGPLQINITFSSEDDSIAHISFAQYQVQSLAALQEKLSQYPKGTEFKWKSFNGGGAAEQQAFARLQQHLEERGMKLSR